MRKPGGPPVTRNRATEADHVGFLVVGTPRSGTTLVQRLALELAGVGMPPETHFFAELALPLLARRRFPLDRVALAEELRAFGQLPSSRGMTFDPTAITARLAGRCSSLIELFDAVVRELVGPAALLGEKTPDHLRWWRPLSAARPALLFVAVVRDPRPVVASNLAAPFRQSRRESWGEDYPLALAVQWRFHQRLILRLAHRLGPRRCLLVRYEDITADPDRVRNQLGGFLQRPVAGRVPPSVGSAVVHPWESWKSESFGKIRDDASEQWRVGLSDRQAQLIVRICGREMRQLGYRGMTGIPTIGTRLPGLSRATRLRLRGLRAGLRNEQARIERCQV